MDAYKPIPRRDDDRNRAEEILRLIKQMKRTFRQMIISALVIGLILGFVAGASYWYLNGYPPGTGVEEVIETAPVSTA